MTTKLENKINVLSLYDGISTGLYCFNKLGIPVQNYYAYEVDKNAIKCSNDNWGDKVTQCGDVFTADFSQYCDSISSKESNKESSNKNSNANGIDFLLAGFPCFKAGTMINTINGFVPIEKIKVGDMVLTHTGTYHKVYEIMNHEVDEFVQLKAQNCGYIECTPNHKFFTAKINSDKCSRNIDTNLNWASVDSFEQFTNTDKYGRKYYLTSVCDNNINEDNLSIDESLYYKIGCDIRHNCSKDKDTKLTSEVINLPKRLALSFLKGFMCLPAENSVEKIYSWNVKNINSIQLAYQIKYMINKYANKLCSVYKDSENNKYILDIGDYNNKYICTDKSDCSVQLQNKIKYLAAPYDQILTIKEKTIVYNLSVEQDESYTANGLVVHNCTKFSIAQKNDRETQPYSGIGWDLFMQAMRARDEAKPKYFIFENNDSMADAIRNEISKLVGFQPIMINSALVSAQNRKRLYWVGKRNEDGSYSQVDIKQPEDRHILLKDILESGVVDRDKSRCLMHQLGNARDYFVKNHSQIAFEPTEIYGVGYRNRREDDGKLYRRFETHGEEKANCLTSVSTDSMIAEKFIIDNGNFNCVNPSSAVENSLDYFQNKNGEIPEMFNPYNKAVITDKSPTLTTGSMITSSCATLKFEKINESTSTNTETNTKTNTNRCIQVGSLPRPNGEISSSQAFRIYSVDGKSVTLKACGGGCGGKTGLYAIEITEEEAEKLRSLDDKKVKRIYEVKSNQIRIKDKLYNIKLEDGLYYIRDLTPVECCRLQTLPDDYCKSLPKTAAQKALGNGWTAEVIIHLMKGVFDSE